MKTKVDLSKWNRYDLFKHYDSCTNPFVILSVNIDITNLYNYAKSNNLSMYASLGYMITKTADLFDAFKYRREQDNIYIYENLIPSFTENLDGNNLFFFEVPYNNNIKEFNHNFLQLREINKNNDNMEIDAKPNEIWFSCAPWFSFNSVVPPFDRENTIPQFIWDKFVIEENKVTTNLMILIHHGFIDGYKLGVFYKKLEENIKEINGDD